MLPLKIVLLYRINGQINWARIVQYHIRVDHAGNNNAIVVL